MDTKYYCRNCGAEVEIEHFKPSYTCCNCNKIIKHKDLMRSWVLEPRIAQLKAMHTLICNANDENIYMSWTYTMPDCPSKEDFFDIALDDDDYNACFDTFVELIKNKGNRW